MCNAKNPSRISRKKTKKTTTHTNISFLGYVIEMLESELSTTPKGGWSSTEDCTTWPPSLRMFWSMNDINVTQWRENPRNMLAPADLFVVSLFFFFLIIIFQCPLGNHTGKEKRERV